MLKQIHLIVNEDELQTIYCALQNVQSWHREAIKNGISIEDHQNCMKKEQKIMEQIDILDKEWGE